MRDLSSLTAVDVDDKQIARREESAGAVGEPAAIARPCRSSQRARGEHVVDQHARIAPVVLA